MSAPEFGEVRVFPTNINAGNAASTPSDYGQWKQAAKMRITKVTVVPSAAVTAHATNYATLTVKAGSTTLGTIVTDVAGGSWVAGTPFEITLTGTGEDVEVSTDEVVSAVKSVAGTGVVLTASEIIFSGPIMRD
jgi:hypothetical protein